MSNLAPKHYALNLVPSKVSTNTSKNKDHEANNKNLMQNDTESFLNSLLESIDKSNEFLPDHMKISEKQVFNETMPRLNQDLFDEKDKISIFESASFMQILSLLDKLQIDTVDIKLGNLSSQLVDLIKTEENFNILKTASNLEDLLDIAKELGLNVKNIKIDCVDELKKTFPNLDKIDFFKDINNNVFKKVVEDKINHIQKNSPHHLEHINHLNHTASKISPKESTSLLSQTLKNLDSILSSKKNKNEKDNKTKPKIQEDLSDLKNDLKNIKSDEAVKNPSKEDLNTKDKKNQNDHPKEKIKELKHDQKQSNNIKDEFKEVKKEEQTKIVNKESKDSPVSENTKDLQKINSQNKTFNQNEKNENKVQEKENLKQEDAKDQNKNVKNQKDLNVYKHSNQEVIKENQDLTLNTMSKDFIPSKEPKTNVKENQDLKVNIFDQKVNFDNLQKDQIVQNKDSNQNPTNTNKEVFIQEQTKINTENGDKNTLEELNSLVKDLNKITHNTNKNIILKETFQHFSQDLKDALDQYKPPVTKLSITLNPNNLGEVEVTLIQRGNNLHINFNSNTNAMNLFIQHQAEFKNSLVNMGFTGLEMNFSDQSKKEHNQNKGKSRNGQGFKEALEGKNENEKINLELVLAKYF